MNDCLQFYEERDARTASYIHATWSPRHVVTVAIGQAAASSRTGQLLLLALVNMLARVHRRLHFVLPAEEVPLQVASFTEATTLQEVVLADAAAIDPCGDFTLSAVPAGITLGIGAPDDVPVDWHLGADRALAFLDSQPVPLNLTDPGSALGAALAACMGASAAFAVEAGLPVFPRRLSAWNYREGDEADPGPADLINADVGRLLMVGAGAVGAALAYWHDALGGGGDWTVIDRDVIALHNTNRGLLFLPRHAGWPSGRPVSKARLIASALGGLGLEAWYDEVPDLAQQRYDVVLALANDRGVRGLLAGRNQPVLMHATTGRNFLSQLHRHVAGRDDCISCRIPSRPAQMPAPCATATLAGPTGEQHDAALPFLSAASGLMLATSLRRLVAGVLTEEHANIWSWYFCSPGPMAFPARSRCADDCSTWWPAGLRAQIYGDTRWAKLEPSS